MSTWILDRIPLDQIVRKTLLFCDEKQPNYVGIEGEQFQELLAPRVPPAVRPAGGPALADLPHADRGRAEGRP
jgi:hypothetical protein